MFTNIDRPAVVVVGIALVLFILIMAAKDHVRKELAYRRDMKRMDKNVDNPANIEALARSIGMTNIQYP